MYYHNINDERYYEFSGDVGLEFVILGKPKKDGTRSELSRRHISNFWPIVVSRVELKNGDNVTILVKLKLVFADSVEDEIFTMPLESLDKICWPNEINLRCILSPDVPKANEHIASIIRSQCFTALLENMGDIDRLGTHIVEGIPVFNAGNQLIWPDSISIKPSVKWEPSPNIRLAIDSNYSEQDADVGMMKIINLSSESGRLLFAFNLLNVMREAFSIVGVTPRSCIFMYGPTGVKKTTFARFQLQLYNRDETFEPLIRLNASVAAAVRLLYEKSDCVVGLDDLFPAQDRDIHRLQEKTLLEILRIIGDGIEPARMRGQKIAKSPPRCGVLFTGEYYIGEGSDAARLLPVRMTIPIDNDKMSACQREPLMLSTFYHFFIRWYITNFDTICGLLKEWIAIYRSTKTGIHDRLQEMQFCLEAAFKLYLTYRIEKGFISKDVSLEQYSSFYQQLRGIVREQNNRANRSKVLNPNIDHLALIRSIYHQKSFSLVTSIKDFEIKEHDGIIHNDHLYLRRDKLLKLIRVYEPSVDFDDILENLKMHQALKKGNSSNSKQLHGGRRNLRFYVVKLSKLTQ